MSTVARTLDSYHEDLEVKDNDVMYKHKTWLGLLDFGVFHKEIIVERRSNTQSKLHGKNEGESRDYQANHA